MISAPGRASLAAARAGHLACACPEDAAARPRRMPGEAALVAGFALMVLAQALTFGVLPLAGAMIAPNADQAGWPVAALLAGAAAASLPAAFLLDAFGRRAAFALGASLGIAGGLLAAYAVIGRAFPLLLVAAAWLGAAQGFALFYRHAAAIGAGPGAAGQVGRLLGAGALAGVAGPLLAGTAEAFFAPYLFVGTLALAALAQLGTLVLALAMPEARAIVADGPAPSPAPLAASGLLLPTLVGALAWAAMSSAMASAPLALAGCGIAVGGITGFVAWHVVAMYAPALVAGRIAGWIGAPALAVAGLALAAGASLAVHAGGSAAGTIAAFLAVGAGWPLATVGATAWLHRAGTPSRLQLAAHDVALLIGAVGGALLR
ncbi:hypothetical protein [Ancylobacter terrae]|uniref:hypothetical protein n=1 Tax=Ancylobacter sp. sgz301288 TaxID=3342077 RepID=UPI00385DDD96